MDVVEAWVSSGRASRVDAEQAQALNQHLALLSSDLAVAETGRIEDMQLFEVSARTAETFYSQSREYKGLGGFWAAGLWVSGRGATPQVALFVDEALAPPSGVELRRTPAMLLAEQFAFPGLDNRILAVGVPSFVERRVSPGERVKLAGSNATLGCRVMCSNKKAITTAGHAAKVVGLLAKQNGSRIGKVVSTAYIDATSVGDCCADLAVIEVDDPASETASLLIQGLTAAKDNDDVVAHTVKGAKPGWVRGTAPSWLRDRNKGAWGQVIFTDQLLTEGGDSGSPVLSSDGSNRLVGHVVAGTASYTLVQDADYQLSKHGVSLR